MKKNVVAHMLAPKESAKSRWRRMDLIPRILCLLLALLLWLLIIHTQPTSGAEAPSRAETPRQEVTV